MSAAFDQLAEDEANALMQLLETETRKVLVVVVSSEARTDERGEGTLCRAVSLGTRGMDVRVFVEALDRKRDRIASKLIKRPGAAA